MVLSEAFQFKMLMSIFGMLNRDQSLLRKPVIFLAITDEFCACNSKIWLLIYVEFYLTIKHQNY